MHLYCNQQLFAWQSHRSHEGVSDLGQDMLTPMLQILASLLHPRGMSPCCLLPGLAASCEHSESVLAESFIPQCFSGAVLVT